MNLPNKLTILRVILVPVFIITYATGNFWLSLGIFCIASVTDFFDGKIARERGLVTNFGKIMDPLADKILVYSALCLFVENMIVPAWTLIIILAREFVIAGMRTVAASEGKVLAAGMSGKIKTVLQMFAVIMFLISLGAAKVAFLMTIAKILYTAALIMTVYSGVEYILQNKEVFSM